MGLVCGCSSSPDQSTAEHQHYHHAPHGGTLVQLGDEFCHLEFVLDSSQGELTAYVLDQEARSAVQVTGGPLKLHLKFSQAQAEELTLQPVADPLTGETAENSSRFSGRSERLQGATSFEGVLQGITVKGRDFSEVEFSFPKGNEKVHDHHGDEH